MKTILIISIIVSLISILFNLVLKTKVNDLVEENKELKDKVDTVLEDSTKSNKYITEELAKVMRESEVFQRKFLYTLSILTTICRYWKTSLKFYNPDASTPTLLIKANLDEQYEVFRIGSKIPLDIDHDFIINNKRVSKIIGRLRTDVGNQSLEENGGFVPTLLKTVNKLNNI